MCRVKERPDYNHITYQVILVLGKENLFRWFGSVGQDCRYAHTCKWSKLFENHLQDCETENAPGNLIWSIEYSRLSKFVQMMILGTPLTIYRMVTYASQYILVEKNILLSREKTLNDLMVNMYTMWTKQHKISTTTKILYLVIVRQNVLSYNNII